MASKKHYVIVAALSVAVLAASTLLLPGKQEVALMNLKDQNFDVARKSYEEQSAQGKLSLEVANHLSELYLQAGAVNKAIEIMEKFVTQNPDNMEARTRLGTLYQYGDQQDAYMRNLEEMNRISPTAANLKILSDIYNSRAEYAKQAATLRQLIAAEQGNQPEHIKALANVLIAQKAPTDAIIVLKNLRETDPTQFTFREEEMLVSLLIDDKRIPEATQDADAWLQSHKDPEQAARLAGILHYRGNPSAAIPVFNHFTDEEINANSRLLEQYVLLQMAQGGEEQAFKRMKSLYSAGTLSPSLNERLLMMAAARGDKNMVGGLLAKSNLTVLDESELLGLLELSIANRDRALMTYMSQAFADQGYQETRPVLVAALAIANRSKDANEKLAKLKTTKIDTDEALQLARICLRMDRTDCADELTDRVAKMPNLTDGQKSGVADLYVAQQQFNKGYAYLNKTGNAGAGKALKSKEAQFAAARGDDAKIDAWLKGEGKDASSQALTELYFVAANSGHYLTANRIAEVNNLRYNTAQTRSILADSYMKTGQFGAAVKLFRQSAATNANAENNYLALLVRLAPKNAEYRNELRTYAANKLRSRIPAKQKMAIIYALINTKQLDIALPYIRELADKEGGQWAVLYAGELDKQGKFAEARPYWVRVANQPMTTDKERRSIAYTLLSHGFKADAEMIFMRLAVKSPATSTDVSELLYLWGPRPNDVQMQWLEARYESATGEDKLQWARHINNYSTPAHLLDFIQRHPESLQDKQLTRRYFEILIENGTFSHKLLSLTEGARETGSTLLIRQYAMIAQEYGYKREAKQAYETVIALDPADDVALRNAGLVSFSLSDFTASQNYLGEYLKIDPQRIDADPMAYQAYFFYGELLRRKKQREMANDYYIAALDSLDKTEDVRPEALSVRAQSTVWMGDVERGLAIFDDALQAYPGDDILRADQASTLLELKRYDDARIILATPPDAALYNQSIATSLPVDDGVVKKYFLRDHDRELVLLYDGPPPDSAALSPKNLQQIPWISYVRIGYDSVLAQAKGGYKFAIETRDQQPTLLIVTDLDSPRAELDRQIILRYELLTARADLETGHIYAATTRINKLLPQYPADPQILGFLANAENYGGNWPRATRLLKLARSVSPENEDLKKFERDVRRLHAENIKLDHEWVKLGRSRLNITTLSGYFDATENMQLGFEAQNNHVKAKGVRLADGRVGTFRGTRQRGELYALFHGENGKQLKTSLFANNNELGGGGKFSFLNPLGETSLTGEWHRPYWGYPENVLDDANRDRLFLDHTIKPRQDLVFTFGGGWNRYNTDARHDVLQTAQGTFGVVYRLLDEQPFLALAYSFDGEYELSHKKDFDATGDYTSLFPFTTREIHFVSLNGAYEFSEDTYGDGLLGYGWDRFGGSGPSIEGRLTHEFDEKKWDVQGRAAFGFNPADTGGSTVRLGAYIRRRF